MCDGQLVRDQVAPLYPTAVGGTLIMGRQPPLVMQEVGVGELVMDRVFRCVPRSGVASRVHTHGREHRVVIQARRGVTIRVSSVEGPSVSRDFGGQVALCAFGDSGGSFARPWRSEPAYTWVQTGHFRPERVVRFDGREEQTDLGWRNSGQRAGFTERGEAWWIDSRSEHSARYAAGGVHLPPIGHANGEIIYDSPDLTVGYSSRLEREPQIRLVETSVQFRTYLYLRPGGYDGIASLDPLVVVEWWHSERWERSAEGAEPRRTASDVRVLWILPNPIEPPSLDDAIRSYRFR